MHQLLVTLEREDDQVDSSTGHAGHGDDAEDQERPKARKEFPFRRIDSPMEAPASLGALLKSSAPFVGKVLDLASKILEQIAGRLFPGHRFSAYHKLRLVSATHRNAKPRRADYMPTRRGLMDEERLECCIIGQLRGGCQVACAQAFGSIRW